MPGLEDAGRGWGRGNICEGVHTDTGNICKSSLHETLVILSCDNGAVATIGSTVEHSPRGFVSGLFCFNHQACLTAWRERRMFPLLRIPPRTGLGTRVSAPSLGQADAGPHPERDVP